MEATTKDGGISMAYPLCQIINGLRQCCESTKFLVGVGYFACAYGDNDAMILWCYEKLQARECLTSTV